MANSWQSPVASEPSLGMLHKLTTPVQVQTAYDPASTPTTLTTTLTCVPAGTKGVEFFAYGRSTDAQDYVHTAPYGSGTAGATNLHFIEVANVPSSWGGWVPVDSSFRFDMIFNASRWSAVYVTITGYYL
jgi:hypothetical protein